MTQQQNGIVIHPDAMDDRFDLNAEDFYEMLGLTRGATAAQIRKAYRKASMKYHPDRNGGTEEAKKLFQRIKLAYETLSDSSKREFYNNTGSVKPTDDELEGKAREIVHQIFTHCLDTAQANDHPGFFVELYDPVAEVVDKLATSLQNIRKTRNDLQRAISRMENLRRRFKKKNVDFSSTPLCNIIDSKVAHNKKVWSMMELDIRAHDYALSFAREYSCAPEQQPQVTVQWHISNTGGQLPPGWSLGS